MKEWIKNNGIKAISIILTFVLIVATVVAFCFEDPNKSIAIAFAQITGGSLAGTLTLIGVIFTIRKQDEIRDDEKRLSVKPLMVFTGITAKSGYKMTSYNQSFFDGNKSNLTCIIGDFMVTNFGKWHCFYTGFNFNNERSKRHILVKMEEKCCIDIPLQTKTLGLYPILGVIPVVELIFEDIYGKEYLYSLKIQKIAPPGITLVGKTEEPIQVEKNQLREYQVFDMCEILV